MPLLQYKCIKCGKVDNSNMINKNIVKDNDLYNNYNDYVNKYHRLEEQDLNEEDIIDNVESIAYLENIYKKWESGSSATNLKKCADTLGRKLNIGDLVIVSVCSGEVMTGRIVDIDKKKGCKDPLFFKVVNISS